ncbi:MAG: hypothetical protein IGS48_15445 [Oscillatoriales cyanobacterium C42_A2020_001]|nr:hypothetical protein [Leptolyngbyaceae cyanobacterium C42_A2020_001]
MRVFNQRHSLVSLGGIVAATGILMQPAIATAPTPPQLVKAVLNGQPVHVLYMTRQGDKVLARCYPGFEPTIAVRAMSGGTKEGVLTCKTAQ